MPPPIIEIQPTADTPYLVYANAYCGHCRRVHTPRYWIRETQRSRFALMQFLMEMSTRNSGNALAVSAGKGQKFMLGVLLTPVRKFVAISGPNIANQAFAGAAGYKHYEICPVRSPNGGNVSIAGRAIPQDEYRGARIDNEPGNCAAPRLVQRALEVYAQTGASPLPSSWEMSEIWYQPNVAGRTQDLYKPNPAQWTHGMTAVSCQTCARLMPLILCTQP